MCGIIGFASNYRIKQRKSLIIGANAMHHRGPDGSGEWWSEDGRVGFAHKRLSIIDLGSSGHQPMNDYTNRYTIVFNGEIYNYKELFQELLAKDFKFNSKSDTEVILNSYRAWGNDCVLHFNGMFAFAIYDSLLGTVFIARDRSGQKPLFYSHKNGLFIFSSELKGLLSDTSRPQMVKSSSLDYYLTMGYIPGSKCLIEGVNKLSAAHYLVFDLNRNNVKVSMYWELPSVDTSLDNYSRKDSCLVDELEGLLETSVQQHLVGDVPIGVLLSGGVDSSLITAMAARHVDRLKTFTIRFPGDKDFDETIHARLISQYFETDHIELEALPVSVDVLTTLACQFDEPIIDSSMIPTFLVSQLVKPHCKVVLGGDGADELFGGYEHYSRLLWMQRYSFLIPQVLRLCVANISQMIMPEGVKGRNWLRALGSNFNNEVPLIAQHFDAKMIHNLLNAHSPHRPLIAKNIFQTCFFQHPELLQRATRTDFSNYLSEDILVKVDRASMLSSVEVRAPFLDNNLIDFAFKNVPSHLKTTHNKRKILLKELASQVLPSDFDMNRKQGFSIPIDNWLKEGEFRDFFYDVLLSPQCVFSKHSVRGLLKGQDKGRNNGERLFGLVMLELWRKNYNISF